MGEATTDLIAALLRFGGVPPNERNERDAGTGGLSPVNPSHRHPRGGGGGADGPVRNVVSCGNACCWTTAWTEQVRSGNSGRTSLATRPLDQRGWSQVAQGWSTLRSQGRATRRGQFVNEDMLWSRAAMKPVPLLTLLAESRKR